MPEYLSPGVFIQEVPSSLKAIEGVSTSTAAFVGPAARGTVPGYAWPSSPQVGLPFQPTDGFVMSPDPAPVLVTSFSEFQRSFGAPLPIPLPGDPDYGYLGHAVRTFFDNGGRRIFIARIVDPATATPSTLRLGQGVAYRLVRSAAAADKTVFFTSTRGINQGDQLVFVRKSDGANPLSTAQPARLTGSTKAEPFALDDGDQVTITPSVGAPVVMKVVGKPAVATSATGPFVIADLDTLQVRVGPPGEPAQTITFRTGDALTPISSPATAAQVQAVLSRYLSGVRCYVDAGKVLVETDVSGTAAALAIVGGSAAAALGFTVAQAAGSNVPDVRRVFIADLQALPAVNGSTDITLGSDGAKHLRITTAAAGAAVTLTLTESPAGVLAKLGLPGAPPLIGTGSGVAPTPLAVASYDMQSNSVTFAAPLGMPLDAGDVYATVPAGTQPPTSGAGPKFYARNPGAWSADISVQVAAADRAPVPIVGAAPAGQNKITVQSVSSFYVGATIEVDHNGASRSIHQVTDVNASLRQLTVTPVLPAPTITSGLVRTLEIDITISDATGVAPTETYRGVTWNPSPAGDLRKHYAWQINARSRLVWVQPPNTGAPLLTGSEDYGLNRQPGTPDGFPLKVSVAGTVGTDGSPPGDAAYVGSDNGPGQRSGIASLLDLTEARIIAAPGRSEAAVQAALIAQCELLRYRFAILDGEQDPLGGSLTSILKHRNLYDTSFAAYYQPWITVAVDGQNRQLPPSGFLAGLYARVDNQRGVWKAPANEIVLDAIGLKTNFTTGEQDLLNPRGVNLVRRFDEGGIRVWGARTLSSDPDVRYINVRRTLIFLEASIDRGTQWVVFEPNTPDTWTRLTNSVRAFLLTQWRSGALFGRKPEDAFYVRCDETTMTSDDILNGRLICQIGVAIVRPAEFVIFQIQQITAFGKQ